MSIPHEIIRHQASNVSAVPSPFSAANPDYLKFRVFRP
jgi:hypothetical protein